MMTKNPPLHLVDISGANAPKPTRALGEDGIKLWNSVQTEYCIADCGGIEMLMQACAGLDRAEGLAAEVAKDGPVIRTRNGAKTHPALKEELACRAFVVRTLARLGLNYEAVRPTSGRPSSFPGWDGGR